MTNIETENRAMDMPSITSRRKFLLGSACASFLATCTPGFLWARPLSSEEADEIAIDAYIYAYPLVVMELTRRLATNVAESAGMHAPMNQFAHAPAFPDPTFTDVVRPNADTLYSSLNFDVALEPIVISVPDSAGRYYMLPMLDAWSDVFASPGSRTTGIGRQLLVLTGPGWSGAIPAGATQIKAPTAQGWIVGRTNTAGKADYAAVHQFQHGMSAIPLSAYGKPYAPVKGKVDSNASKTPPVDAIEQMSAAAYFALFAQLMKTNPPHANDYPILERMARLGIVPGRDFSIDSASADARQALASAPVPALKRIKNAVTKSGTLVNGWHINLNDIGTYGTDFLRRASVAYAGLGANTVEDAVYPSAFTQEDGRPFDSGERYILHFEKGQLPPVRGFWSLTLYDQRQLFAANPIDRYAIGDRDKLTLNADGSLDLHIQRESPGQAAQANWLPAPKDGPFTLNMRLYWPEQSVLDGSWNPPPVRLAG